MRIGNNPAKKNSFLITDSYHRVIVPIYIPNLEEEYFKDALNILKLCIESLLKTIHKKTRITLIDNNCCKEVKNYLEFTYNANSKVDQLLKCKKNLGKVNALYSAIKSNLEDLITITDADVMFLPSWQNNVEKIINLMPEAGMVSPVPSSVVYKSDYIASTIYYGFIKGKISLTEVVDPNGMVKFQKSIGRENMYNKQHLSKYFTIENPRIKAVIGCGHFVATFRAEVFKNAPNEVCRHKIGGKSENMYFDLPNDKGNFLRLATLGNYAYHLGNRQENWMHVKFREIKNSSYIAKPLDTLTAAKPLNNFSFLIGKILHKIFFKKFKKQYFKFKGMNKEY